MKLISKLGRMPVVLTVPALILLVAVFIVPIVELFLMSLGAPSLSLKYYRMFFAEPSSIRVLLQTIQLSAVATLICAVVGYPTAYFIASASKTVRLVLMVLVLLPWLTSALVRTYAWVVILGDRGLVNTVLLNLKVIASPLELIYNRFAVYIGMVHIMLPVMILPMLSVMLGMDKSLMAAARSMGASPFTAFWRVYFPLSLPGLRSGLLLVFVGSLGFYITPAALGGLRDVMMSNFIATQMSTAIDLAPITAPAFILLLIGAVAVLFLGINLSSTGATAAQNKDPKRGRVWGRWKNAVRPIPETFTSLRSSRWKANLYQSGGSARGWSIAGAAFAVVVIAFLQFPGLIVIILSFTKGAILQFPPKALSLQWYQSFFGDASWTGAAWMSLQIALIVTLSASILGTVAAFGLSRTSPRLRSLLTLVMLMPITLPVIIVGLAAYLGLLKFGLLGTPAGIVLAHTVGAICYVVVIVSATLANFDRQLERAAMSMRAGPVQTFWRITVPLIRPGIIGGAVFAFIHSFDEVAVTSLVSNFTANTLPLKMLENINNQIDPTIAAVGSLLTLLPVLWLLALYAMYWRPKQAERRVDATAEPT